ncbi:DUF1795 domain-containing protein [Pseudomonas sp. SDI]|uniref:DcrB-related protein n=1 Tax=Pseudomonas sp. SDI TaxID=2170734 RepID=UPI000DE65DE5|nr:DUF1795 domain-containing protein [Pseudomonas sp. SDI]PWB32604.1 DUF1795 domain-containing protein [Pseudomonas sp. SDI]
MDYLLQEGRLTLPDGFSDRSVNMFIPGNVVPAVFSLTVGRDQTLPGESLDQYLERQLELIAIRLRQYTRLGSAEVWLGTQAPLAGMQVDAHFNSDGRVVYQRQAAFLIAEERVLVFSATAQSPFDAALDQTWQEVLASFQAHPFNTTP